MVNLENISFDHCIKCTVCTVYCPVARVTHLYPGPKHSGPDAERLRIKNVQLVDSSVQYCNNCKRCEIACPSDVKIADIIQNARQRYVKKKIRLRDFILSRTDLVGRFSTWMASVTNFLLKLTLVRHLFDFFLKIPAQRPFPEYMRHTFSGWYRKHKAEQENYGRKVVYFHGCYVNYNDHDLGKAVFKVFNAIGIGGECVAEKCCGVPLIANGYLEKAKKNARHNIRHLAAATKGTEMKIVSASSTCLLALKKEYRDLLQMDNGAISERLEYITEFVCKQWNGGASLTLKPLKLKVVYHSPCHLERMGSVIYTIDMLTRIPGIHLTVLNSECCGISGTYGFKQEYFQIAQDIGAEIFKQINRLNPDIVVTDCETCKWQIEMNTPFKVVHPIALLAESLE